MQIDLNHRQAATHPDANQCKLMYVYASQCRALSKIFESNNPFHNRGQIDFTPHFERKKYEQLAVEKQPTCTWNGL